MEDSQNEMDSPKEFNCIFCKETFECKEELQIHFRKHGDPKFNQSSKSKVRPSNESPGEKSSEEVEMISCDVCPELFPTISKAITHKHKVHPDHDAKYFCPWCGKLFTMKHLYNKHMSTNHENSDSADGEDYPCDCCDVTFHVASAMLYHNKFFHRQDTDLPSIGQSKKLKMADQNSITIYYCPFCGQEYNNKVNLHKHMTDDHSDENQSPDDVLRCPLCDAIFYHLDAYEHHLIFHSVEDMYSEKNEMVESVTEFSLESVPPIMERVENLEPEPKETAEGGEMGLDDLLQMAMGNTVDEEHPKKSKKHKKHKKSKKAAITLDEFLNMNKDVFGEGIDFQGIEEVPSQVVAKKLKVRKQPTPKTGSKMSPKEIEKLRKQGIVIKMKPGSSMKKQTPAKVKQMPKNLSKADTQINSNTASSPNDVLSKLMNQSNSQIKIVRKPAQTKNEAGSLDDEKPSSPENIEVECDFIPRDTSSETETEDKIENKLDKYNENKKLDIESKDMNKIKHLNNIDFKRVTNTGSDSIKKSQSERIEQTTEENNDSADDKNDDTDNSQSVQGNSLKTLKNVSHNSTVKPISFSPKIICDKSQISKCETNNDLAEIKQKGQTETNEASNENEPKEKPLNALKHLSHLITIKSVPQQPKSVDSPSSVSNRDSSDGEKSPANHQINSDEENEINDAKNTLPAITNRKVDLAEPTQASIKSLNTLKNISSNVTIKPTTKSIISADSQLSHSSDEEEHDDSSIQDNLVTKQCLSRPTTLKPQNVKSPASSPKLTGITSSTKNVSKESNITNTEDNTKNPSNIALLKNLTNVTAKTIGSPQNIQINKCTPTNKKISHNKIDDKINQEIEIYNIDDSDSDNEDHPPSEINKMKISAAQNHRTDKQVEAFKNLSKHLTIKSTLQKPLPVKTIKPDPDQDEFADFPEGAEDSDTEADYYTDKKKISINKTNSLLQNTLKNLGKHITIKSRNSSPSSVNTSHGPNNEDSSERFDMNNADSDNDSNPGRVKITEVDDQVFPDQSDEFDEDFNENTVVQSPPDSGSDNEEYTQKPDDDDDVDDIESKIQASTLMKTDSKHEESFRNLGKGITIKSLSEKKTQSHTETAPMTKGPSAFPGNLSKELSIKPFRQGNKGPSDNNVSQQSPKMNQQVINKGKTTGKQIAKCTNQSTNQKMCATNQTNTVNKEVTVKTFQTQTVIQEITTTVTKTIKTVNQTMKQEVQSSSQSCTQNVMRKVQGMRPAVQQPGKNYQGVVVRHATPTTGAKVRGGKTSIRPTRPAVKVSNQLVPMRAATPMNIRPQTPRMPAIRGNAPSTSTNSSKPIKISPNIVNSGIKKRPAAPEPAGPFSCFKKPKESLMSISEMSGFQGRDDDSMISFASSSQMNKSNVMNMTRTMKGNTVVSSTQMKSEVSSCSQQLNKLNNVTGLRIVKTSQVKQASHVEEWQEASPAKRMTQEAIEKLQKQGLLVKKPRFDTNEEDYSDDDDEGGGHFPPYDEDEDFDAE